MKENTKVISIQVEKEEFPIVIVLQDGDGKIKNYIDYGKFHEESMRTDKSPEIYLAFIIKTIVDDFSCEVGKLQDKIDVDSLRAAILKTATEMLNEKTRIDG
jgi:hypothetical protein